MHEFTHVPVTCFWATNSAGIANFTLCMNLLMFQWPVSELPITLASRISTLRTPSKQGNCLKVPFEGHKMQPSLRVFKATLEYKKQQLNGSQSCITIFLTASLSKAFEICSKVMLLWKRNFLTKFDFRYLFISIICFRKHIFLRRNDGRVNSTSRANATCQSDDVSLYCVINVEKEYCKNVITGRRKQVYHFLLLLLFLFLWGGHTVWNGYIPVHIANLIKITLG